MKITCKIYADPSECQLVTIEYTGSGMKRFYVDSLKVLTPIELEPSDLITDLELAISESEHSVSVTIDCEIEYTELVRTPMTGMKRTPYKY